MSFTESLLLWATPTTFAVYFIICLLPSVFMAFQAKKLRGDTTVNTKYYAFHRHDVQNWTVLRLTLCNFFFLFPIRFGIAWCIVLWQTTLILIVMIGQPKDKKLTRWRELFLRYSVKPVARLHLLCSGCVWVNYNYKKDIDYKQWLGDEWVPSFEGAGIQVCNHQSWLDIMLFIYSDFPSFIADSKVKDLPGVGIIAQAAQTVFTIRGGSKEARK